MARTATKKSTGARKKPRSAAQKAATAKMLAANKRARAGKTSAAAKPAAKKRPAYKKAAAAKPAARKYKRNPVAGKAGGVVDMLLHDIAIPAGMGAIGGLGVDAVWGNLKFIPIEKRTGKMRYLGKSLIGVGSAVLVHKFVKNKAVRKAANQAASFVLGLQAYEAGKEAINAKFPNASLAGYDDSELNEVIENLNGLGEGLSLPAPTMNGLGGMNGLGFYTATAYSGYATA